MAIFEVACKRKIVKKSGILVVWGGGGGLERGYVIFHYGKI